MAKMIQGVGRVAVFAWLHTWPDGWAVGAYTTTGDFGDTAIVSYIPRPDVADVPLMDVAARHEPSKTYGSAGARHAEACWLICTGWSALVVPKPGTLIREAQWELELDGTTELKQTMYGHDRLHVGRLALTDPDLHAQAQKVLESRVFIGG
ncbi:hypothetical protein [Streptomyces luteireticuli]|uniref:Uncharacterized protein n=1 Tax=Streptomyces luteireticuli TaxID=173858 RepID=A0ABP3IIX3_9ACTN